MTKSQSVSTWDAVQQWHVHDCDFQMVYVLNGWATFEYEGQGKVRLEAGSCVHQPPGIRHRELGHSDDIEMLELCQQGIEHAPTEYTELSKGLDVGCEDLRLQKGALSADGLVPDKGADTAFRALASVDPEIAKAKLDLAAVYTNDFAKKANAKYPKG